VGKWLRSELGQQQLFGGRDFSFQALGMVR
jgi:hypothetical protein